MDNAMVRCPHCFALVFRHPEDEEQYCTACHQLFNNRILEAGASAHPQIRAVVKHADRVTDRGRNDPAA